MRHSLLCTLSGSAALLTKVMQRRQPATLGLCSLERLLSPMRRTTITNFRQWRQACPPLLCWHLLVSIPRGTWNRPARPDQSSVPDLDLDGCGSRDSDKRLRIGRKDRIALRSPGLANLLICATEGMALARPAAGSGRPKEMETVKKWTISKELRSTEQVRSRLLSQDALRPCVCCMVQELRKRRQRRFTDEPGSAGAEPRNSQDWRHAPREGATVL